MLRHTRRRTFLITLLLILGLSGGAIVARQPFPANIQTALLTLGLWPYGVYGNNEVPVWDASENKFVPGSAGGGGLETDINISEVGGVAIGSSVPVTANAGTNLNTSALLTSANFAAAYGTAGTADTQVMSIQGIAAMTPILATLSGTNNIATVTTVSTVTAVTGITNTVNVLGTLANDTNAAAANRLPTMGVITETSAPTRTNGRNAALSGTVGGAIRAMLSDAAGTALNLVFGTATYTEATSAGFTIGAVRTDTPAALVNTTNEIGPLATSALGGVYTASASDPCSRLAKTPIVINIATGTTTELTPSLAGASNYYYVCSISLGPTAGAQNFALVDDDSDNCGSVTSGMAGGTTAASGWNIGANGGLGMGNGLGTVFKTNGTNRVICAVTSASQQVSGTMMVVAAP